MLELNDDPSTAARAREFVTEVCTAWRLPPGVVGTATDVANELVANAVHHGERAQHLTLEFAPEHLTIRVFDTSTAPPRQRAYVPGVSVRGLGLRLVDQLAASWGHVPWNGGKYVWALVRVARGPGERRDG
jgi:two-component sensor histidine kinase